MSIWNKILIFLIISLSIACFVFAIKIYDDRRKPMQTVTEGPQKIEDEIKKYEKVFEGDESNPGVRDTNLELRIRLYERQPAWFGCIPLRVDLDKGYIDSTLRIDAPEAGLRRGTFVYVFEEATRKEEGEENYRYEGSKYLGAFVVTNTALNSSDDPENAFVTVSIASYDFLSNEEMDAVKTSANNNKFWAVYTKLPTDRSDLFEGMEDEEFSAIVPTKYQSYFSDSERALIDFEGRLKYLYQDRETLHSQIVDLEGRLEGLREHDKPIADNLLKWNQDTKDMLMKECIAMAAQLVQVGSDKVLIRLVQTDRQQQTVMEVTKEKLEEAARAQNPEFNPADYYTVVGGNQLDQQTRTLIANGSNDENIHVIPVNENRVVVLEITPGGLISDFERLIARQKSDIEREIQKNEQLARDIAEAQQQAVDLIERRGGHPNQN